LKSLKEIILGTTIAISLNFGFIPNMNHTTVNYTTVNSNPNYSDEFNFQEGYNLEPQNYFEESINDESRSQDKRRKIRKKKQFRKFRKEQKKEIEIEETKSKEPFDYCKLTVRGKKEKVTMYESDFDEINSLEVKLKDIKLIDKGNQLLKRLKKPAEYNIILVPVGYDGENKKAMIKERMTQLIDTLDVAFIDIPVDFTYLNESVPIGINREGRRPAITNRAEADIVLSQINKVYPAHNIIFVTASQRQMGVAWKYAIIGGESPNHSYSAVHEAGHLLDLDDGYKKYYGKSGINGTELVIDTNKLPSRAKKAYEITNPQLELAPGVCGTEKVYSFYESGTDIMDRFFKEEEVNEWLENEKSLFNPMQKIIMKLYVEERLVK
jgi:hypothetical protein